MGYKNLNLMIPFARTVADLLEVKKLVSASGLRRSSNFQFWLMVEIPANVILLEDFLAVGVDGVSIGSNDLTMLTLGVDRDNSKLAKSFDERNKAVMTLLETIIKTCKKNKVTCSICGQAPSEYPEIVKDLVKWGITSVSVNPDVIDSVRLTVYEAEKEIVTDSRR
jgi:pyruvate,water dikinase